MAQDNLKMAIKQVVVSVSTKFCNVNHKIAAADENKSPHVEYKVYFHDYLEM
jgi:hypothetical protein